ncbi:hypothetical protein [Cryobacterium algoricola]|uniref:hypothetical protein n=1 Tax=Cryobacterium algoricola TaxID=1259183 RepID=UPI00141B9892|nr:hypothetical protein [Cryobacterium algoricola]
MTKPSNTTTDEVTIDEVVVSTKNFYFPYEGISVQATDQADAEAQLQVIKESEGGDVSS